METAEVQKLHEALDAVYGGGIWRHVVENRGREWVDIMADAVAGLAPKSPFPIDMVLFCPACGTQHIDAPEGPSQRENDSPEVAEGMAILDGAWENPPHRSHMCYGCGHIWRPADVPTSGVAAVKTKGENDGPLPDYIPHLAQNLGKLPWRCYHCNEVFADREKAEEHFGRTERHQAICTFDPTHFRWMEEQHRRNCEEDTEVLRTLYRMQGEQEEARRRAEEQGYARGLADAKKHPEDLGLAPAPSRGAKANSVVTTLVVHLETGEKLAGGGGVCCLTPDEMLRTLDTALFNNDPVNWNWPDKVELAPEAYAAVRQMVTNAGSERMSVLAFLERNNIAQMNGHSLIIRPWAEKKS